jgi:hypothetical protein
MDRVNGGRVFGNPAVNSCETRPCSSFSEQPDPVAGWHGLQTDTGRHGVSDETQWEGMQDTGSRPCCQTSIVGYHHRTYIRYSYAAKQL